MKLHELKPKSGSKSKPKRVGRGKGSGLGKTSGRGHKGQGSRSGGSMRPGFEGGQMPLQRRIPKRGFYNRFRKEYAVVNVEDLNRFRKGSVVDTVALVKAGLVNKIKDGVKILGRGEISKSLTVRVDKISSSASEKIIAAGGSVEVN